MAGSLLNLTEADENAFEPLPAGTYIAEVFEVTMAETKGGENAKLPKGTPMMKVQFKCLTNDENESEILDDEGKKIKLENRRFFGQYVIPPKEIEGKKYEHYEMMNGQIVRLFKALGFDEKDIKNPKGFNPDFDDMVGKQLRVTVGRDMEYNSNPVKGVKPLEGEAVAGLL